VICRKIALPELVRRHGKWATNFTSFAAVQDERPWNRTARARA